MNFDVVPVYINNIQTNIIIIINNNNKFYS